MLGALMERKAQRGTNRACSGMVATVALPHTVQGLRRWAEHLGGDGIGGVTSLELFSCSVSLCVLTYYRPYDCFPLVKARDDALLRGGPSTGSRATMRGTRKGLEGLGGLRNGAGNTVRNEQCSIAEWSKARER